MLCISLQKTTQYLPATVVELALVIQDTKASSFQKAVAINGIIIVLAPFSTLGVTNALESGCSVKEEGKEQKGGEESLVEHDEL